MSKDLPAIIKAENPFIILQDPKGSGVYGIKAEIYIGGRDGSKIYIGTPSVSLRNTEEIRVLFPNEARLRNLTYASQITADIYVRITYLLPDPAGGKKMITNVIELDPESKEHGYLQQFPLLKMPIMLHSRFCSLYANKFNHTKMINAIEEVEKWKSYSTEYTDRLRNIYEKNSKIKDMFIEILHCGMYMRGWKVVSDKYPLSEKNTKYENNDKTPDNIQSSIEYNVTESIQNVMSKLNEYSSEEKKILN